MEHIAALLLIVGCSGDLRQCAEIPAPTSVYETSEECDAELAPSLAAARGHAQRVFAACVPVDPAMEEEDALLSWDVTPDGRLVAAVEAIGNAAMARVESVPASNWIR
jgi:hypothetical protein